MNNKKFLVSSERIRNVIIRVLVVNGVDGAVAKYVADGLVQTSLRGIDSHGVRLFPHYLEGLKAGRLNGNPHYSFSKTSASTGLLDADHTFGHAAGMEAVKHAVEMANDAGSAHISVRNSSHFGAAAYFGLEIARHNMIGLSFTHANSFMLSHNSTQPFFGTNPLCFCVPCEGEEPFCLDMATTLWTVNKVVQCGMRGEKLPAGVAVDASANETCDPNSMASLLPMGMYKGFGLAFMIEILCGLLSGMPIGKEISNMYETPINEKRFLGQFFMAIKIDNFMPADEFRKKMTYLMNIVRSQPRKDPDVPVIVPGDPEKKAFEERSKNGIPIDDKDWEAFQNIAAEYNVLFA